MIWTILGISVAIIAVFCITVAETLVGQPLFEHYRAHSALALGVVGGVAWIIGRIISAKETTGEQAARRFVLIDLRYWGPMLLVLGVITLFIRPLRFSRDVKPIAAVVQPVQRKIVPPPAPAKKPPAVVSVQPRTFPELKLQGVIFRTTRPFVILNGHSYTVGDRFGDVLVREIDRSSVMLELDGELKVLTMN